MRRPVRPAALLAATALLCTACSGGVSVDAYPTEPDTAADCGALYADLPRTVAGLEAQSVPDDVAAAWGDPAVILRCGVEKPEGLVPGARCDTVDDVDWFTDETADGYLFTTIGRRFHVSVEVPAEHDPAADALVDLAAAVKKHDPSVQPCLGNDEVGPDA